jgi:homoserine dehydrogenase
MSEPADIIPSDEISGRYYIRTTVKDQSGVLSQITAAFAEHDISISSVLQKGNGEDTIDNYVSIVIITHVAKEGSIVKALKEVDKFSFSNGKSVYLSIIDEHKESL